jgi:hypothetical protein
VVRPPYVLASFAALPWIAWLSISATTPKQSPSPRIDPVALLIRDLESGKKTLSFNQTFGYLPSLLQELQVPVSSQTLVFSKTSLQSSYITPSTPRALYFNDKIYIGWIKNAPLIEIMSIDPLSGARFYTIENTNKPKQLFSADGTECFRCHGGRRDQFSPRLFVRSAFIAPSGYTRYLAPDRVVTSRTPHTERWGGWYVTGSHGKLRHMGNALALGNDENYTLDREKGANITDLSPFIDPKQYLTTSSDIVALLTMEHLMEAQNDLSVWASQAHQLENNDREEKVRVSQGIADSLFLDSDAPFVDTIKGNSSFTQDFVRQYPRSSNGKSLASFELTKRLFHYNLSPLIYSETFRHLPPWARQQAKERVHLRLRASGTLGQEAIQILRETHPEFREDHR